MGGGGGQYQQHILKQFFHKLIVFIIRTIPAATGSGLWKPWLKPVFHFNRIVVKRCVFYCVHIINIKTFGKKDILKIRK